ncbi:hypothetical protein L1049_015155 [Liquidambar formosana]|uniref:DUF8039 domain-containing protein n=1 Tax=Liquidambar formosana TaxID=63359 RepID=A0AAP0X2B8_LIQFO
MGSSSKKGKGKGRGITYLPRLTKSRSAGIKHVVEYNSKGVPRGKVATTYSSYCGTLARTRVPIIYANWYEVPKELKDKLWSCVEETFDLDPKSKKNTLSSISLKWKNFKNRLTTKYIIPSMHNIEVLRHPPKLYKDYIEKEHWHSFVKGRISPQFQALRRNQQERRGKNSHNHRLSRKGYVGLEDEIVSGEGLDRSVMWKMARQNKEGFYDDEGVKERAAKIDELTQQVNDGHVKVEGSNDILTLALGKPEHSSGVRGVGKESVKGKPMGKLCSLAVGSLTNVVARGMVVESMGPTVHSIPLGDKNVRVAIDFAIDGNALLPIPVGDELVTVKQAIGSHVAWPKMLVVSTPTEGPLGKRQLPHKKAPAKSLTDNPPVIDYLFNFAEKVFQKKGSIQITFEVDIFGKEFPSYLLLDDISWLCHNEELSVTCIMIYIK